MKKLFLLVTLTLFIGSFSYAQCSKSCKSSCGKSTSASTTIPSIVKTSFAKLYPDAGKVKWKKEDGNYEANYQIAGKEASVLLDKTGKVIMEEVEIEVSALPTTISNYIKKNYKDSKIDEVAKITKAGKTYYEVELAQGTKEIELLFDAAGKLITNED